MAKIQLSSFLKFLFFTLVVFPLHAPSLAVFNRCVSERGRQSVWRLFTRVMVAVLSSPWRILGNCSCYFILGQCQLMTGSKDHTGQLAQSHNPGERPQWSEKASKLRVGGVPSQHSTNHSTRNYDKHHSGNQIQQYIVFFFSKTTRLLLT